MSPATKLPDPLTGATIRDAIANLDDQKVRELLIKHLDNQLEAKKAKLDAATSRPNTNLLVHLAQSLAQGWRRDVASVPKIPKAASSTLDRFMMARGDKPASRLAMTLGFALLSGVVASVLMARVALTRTGLTRFFDQKNSGTRVIRIAFLFAQRFLVLAVFVSVSLFANACLNAPGSADGRFVDLIVGVVGWSWFAVILARALLAPEQPELRLCQFQDVTARFLTWRVALIFGWSALAAGLLQWMEQYGWPFDSVRPGLILSLVFHGLVIATVWQVRGPLVDMLLAQGGKTRSWRWFATAWPGIAIGLVAMQWLIVELIAATGNGEKVSIVALNLMLASVLALPLFEVLIRGVVGAAWATSNAKEPGLEAADEETRRGLVRFGRAVLATGLIALLAIVWGLDLTATNSADANARLVARSAQIGLALVSVYGLWELLNTVVNRQLAVDRAISGFDPTVAPGAEVGGKGATRLGTIMPLVKWAARVFVVVLGLLTVLGQFGVNIWPLLAGAGIVGLAIGFGAQTLVKDVISGLFFLIDDSFRTGEYIDIGSVKGTVEKISIRSMQLRHHNGPLNTVPFGSINHLTNFSRDWAMMKLSLRVTYDTDVERMRKLIKKLGQELMDDPNLGPLFLQPLKSQGVIQMDDSAMIVRVKFMTRPGDQFGLRRHVFTRLHELFEREGIKFAHREVTVRIADDETATGAYVDELGTEQRRKAATAAARAVLDTPAS